MITRTRKALLAGASVIALGAGALAVGTDAAQPVTGPQAERAKLAAIESTGGGDVVGVERGGGAWQVKVVRDEPDLERSTYLPANRDLLVVYLSDDLEPTRIEAG